MRTATLLLAAALALGGCATPGDPHPRWPHVVTSASGNWQPAPGYDWTYPGDQNNLSVRWAPGKSYWAQGENKWPNIHASKTEGSWTPAPGYNWVDAGDRANLAVRWQAGLGYWHLGENTFPYVIAHAEEGSWVPQTGYEWARPGADGRPKPGDLAVVSTADRLAFEQRRRERREREEVLTQHWVKYLKEIQAQNTWPNWSAPPYDLYVRNRK